MVPHRRRAYARLLTRQLLIGDRPHFNVDINAVEGTGRKRAKGSAEPAAVCTNILFLRRSVSRCEKIPSVTAIQGSNLVIGSNPERIAKECKRILSGKAKRGRQPDLWDGKAAQRIVDVLLNWDSEENSCRDCARHFGLPTKKPPSSFCRQAANIARRPMVKDAKELNRVLGAF